MGETSGIEWTSSTWNPWVGCHKVSQGCRFCYAERQTEEWGKKFSAIRRTSDKTFFAPLHWGQLTERTWPGFPHRLIFTCSFSDFFLVEADPWRSEVWDIIRKTPQHIYQILTKRPERIRECLPPDWGSNWPGYANVWLGTSVENQEWAEKRIPILTSIPATVHFLSVEPLLEPVSLEGFRKLEWVIVGGESGPKHRPMKVEWVTRIRDQCVDSGVPFFFKQHGGRYAKEGGRDLEGREWNEFPQIAGTIQARIG